MSNGKWEGPWENGGRMFRAIRRRIAASLAIVVGGLVGLLYYLFVWAGRFNWYQNFAVVLSTILIVPTVLIGLWVFWGLGLARRAAWLHHVDAFDDW